MPIGPWSPNAKKWFTHQDVLIAVEQARREAFEEAAQIAASYGAPVVPVVQRVTARDIADAIRARGEAK